MNVTDYLGCAEAGERRVVFEGEPFTALSLLSLRAALLGASA
jgi:hypothetical protein